MTDTKVVVSDDTSQKVDTSDKTTPKTYEESEFKAVVAARDSAKQELRTLQAKLEEDIKNREQTELKAKGDYETLIAKVQKERTEEKDAMNRMIQNTFINVLSLKHGLLKPEYAGLFKADVKINGIEIENASDVETSFEEFKKANPTLFGVPEKKTVPSTDSSPQAKVTPAMKDLSAIDLVKLGVVEEMAKWHKI